MGLVLGVAIQLPQASCSYLLTVQEVTSCETCIRPAGKLGAGLWLPVPGVSVIHFPEAPTLMFLATPAQAGSVFIDTQPSDTCHC